MKVELEKSFPLPGPADVAWACLQDIEAVAGCMPGATITERLPDGRYKGTVSARVGPATMSFRGELEVRDVDAAARSLRLLGKGVDSTGTSGASMTLTARVEALGDGSSKLAGTSEMTVSGRAAAFGGRMLSSIADQILGQFAANFAALVQEREGHRGSEAVPSPVPPRAGRPLNALAIVWAAFRDWLRGLVRRSSA